MELASCNTGDDDNNGNREASLISDPLAQAQAEMQRTLEETRKQAELFGKETAIAIAQGTKEVERQAKWYRNYVNTVLLNRMSDSV